MHIADRSFRYFNTDKKTHFTFSLFFQPRTTIFLGENLHNMARLDSIALSVDIGYSFNIYKPLSSSPSLPSSPNFMKYKTGKYISCLKLWAGVQCWFETCVWMECSRMWCAFLSKHSRSRKPRAIWPGLASSAVWFEPTVFFLPHSPLLFSFSAPFTL